MIKILFLASNPIGTTQLQLDEEIRSIEQKLEASVNRDEVQLKSLWAVRPDDLLEALMKQGPQVVHFSGHGDADGQIIFKDQKKGPIGVSQEALRMLFVTLKDNIKLAVLNACYSEKQAAAIAEVIDCVVGMSKEVGDDAAIIFAASFYSAICSGRSVQQAFDLGKTAILLHGIAEAETPKLRVRAGVDPSQVFLTGQKAVINPLELAKEAPKSIIELLKSGCEFIDVVSMAADPHPASSPKNFIFCELRMTQSDAVFVFRVDKRTTIENAAQSIAKYIDPKRASEDYVWSLNHNGKIAPGYLSFAAAGIKSGDFVNLIGNHKHPKVMYQMLAPLSGRYKRR